jgi:hypothetical protein
MGSHRALRRGFARRLIPGRCTHFTAIFVDGNTIDPSVGILTFESK